MPDLLQHHCENTYSASAGPWLVWQVLVDGNICIVSQCRSCGSFVQYVQRGGRIDAIAQPWSTAGAG